MAAFYDDSLSQCDIMHLKFLKYIECEHLIQICHPFLLVIVHTDGHNRIEV